MSEKVPWTDPDGTSCCCCDLALPYARQVPISKEQYEMFRSGGKMTLGAFAVESSVQFKGRTSGIGAENYTTNIAFDAERKLRIGVNGPNSIAILNQAVADGDMRSALAFSIKQLNCYPETHELPVYADSSFGSGVDSTFAYRTYSTSFGFAWVSPRNYIGQNVTGAFNYGHTVRKKSETIDGTFSDYWLAHCFNLGIGLVFDYRSQPNDSGASIEAAIFVSLRSRNPLLTDGIPSNATGNNTTINLQTPLGNLPMLVTDCTGCQKPSSIGSEANNFLSEISTFPTLVFEPSAP